ncbi:MAG: hypothetical protein QW815_05665 [Nitrososphaerota archaeon]
MLSEGKELRLLRKIYRTLLHVYGKQNWWPGESDFEVAIGAILVQRTSWRNVAKAITRLKEQNLIGCDKVLSITKARLIELLRPVGMAELKAERLIRFSRLVYEKYGGSLQGLLRLKNSRDLLLEVDGIGDETADSILLYAGNRPYLPIGAYTRRCLERIGYRSRGYQEWQELAIKALPKSVDAYKEFHALFVAHGKKVCRKQPLCRSCPLTELCSYASKEATHSQGRSHS